MESTTLRENAVDLMNPSEREAIDIRPYRRSIRPEQQSDDLIQPKKAIVAKMKNPQKDSDWTRRTSDTRAENVSIGNRPRAAAFSD